MKWLKCEVCGKRKLDFDPICINCLKLLCHYSNDIHFKEKIEKFINERALFYIDFKYTMAFPVLILSTWIVVVLFMFIYKIITLS